MSYSTASRQCSAHQSAGRRNSFSTKPGASRFIVTTYEIPARALSGTVSASEVPLQR